LCRHHLIPDIFIPLDSGVYSLKNSEIVLNIGTDAPLLRNYDPLSGNNVFVTKGPEKCIQSGIVPIINDDSKFFLI